MPPSRLITRKCIYACVCRDTLKFVNLDLLAYIARTRLHVFRILRWFGGKGRSCNRVGAVIRSVVRGDMNGKGSIRLMASEDLNLAA